MTGKDQRLLPRPWFASSVNEDDSSTCTMGMCCKDQRSYTAHVTFLEQCLLIVSSQQMLVTTPAIFEGVSLYRVRASQVVLVVKNPPANAVGLGSIPGLVRSPGVGNCNPLQYSFMEKSHGQRSSGGLQSMEVTQSRKQLSTHTPIILDCFHY